MSISSILHNRVYIQTIVITVQILFFLLVANGIHITIHNFEKVYLHEFK